MEYFINKLAGCIVGALVIAALRSDAVGLLPALTLESEIVVFCVTALVVMICIPLSKGRKTVPAAPVQE